MQLSLMLLEKLCDLEVALRNKSQSTSSNLFGEADESDDDLFGELNSEKPNEDLFLDPEPDDTGTDIAGTTQGMFMQSFSDMYI
ncbi:hypothetical protein HOLleu_39741 [Holothuria leucospilota]|uniref:Uncharacterized protein n=1 Tax=Holothuria leucospilota TaxID=206669 RepID=A0A9Q0YCC7_HOLLE|nr:hypothetical protein HOLleu_39741 [Holothuria leucospilota]